MVNDNPVTLDFSVMSIGALKESKEVLLNVKPDPIVNMIIRKIKEELQRRENASKS